MGPRAVCLGVLECAVLTGRVLCVRDACCVVQIGEESEVRCRGFWNSRIVVYSTQTEGE